MSRKGRIVEILSDPIRMCSVVQGIPKQDQGYYEESSKYCGGNGTYYSNFRSDPRIMMKIVVYAAPEYEQRTITMDVRDWILDQNPGWQRITGGRLQMLKDKLESKKIDLIYNESEHTIGFDPSILRVQ